MRWTSHARLNFFSPPNPLTLHQQGKRLFLLWGGRQHWTSCFFRSPVRSSHAYSKTSCHVLKFSFKICVAKNSENFAGLSTSGGSQQCRAGRDLKFFYYGSRVKLKNITTVLFIKSEDLLSSILVFSI